MEFLFLGVCALFFFLNPGRILRCSWTCVLSSLIKANTGCGTVRALLSASVICFRGGSYILRSSCQKLHWIHRRIQRPRVCSHPLLEDGLLTLLCPGFFPWFISSSLAILSSSLQNTPSVPPLWWPYFDLAVALPFFLKIYFILILSAMLTEARRDSISVP